MLTQEEIKKSYFYDSESGLFYRRFKDGSICKTPSTRKGGSGYVCLQIKYKGYVAHRLAWIYVHGGDIPVCIDHINGDRSDNRISNLRLATRTDNARNCRLYSNNASGYKGVYWNKCMNKWEASIRINKKLKRIGWFDHAETAYEAYKAFAIKEFGEFACLTR